MPDGISFGSLRGLIAATVNIRHPLEHQRIIRTNT
jgi:hypothetical protein